MVHQVITQKYAGEGAGNEDYIWTVRVYLQPKGRSKDYWVDYEKPGSTTGINPKSDVNFEVLTPLDKRSS